MSLAAGVISAAFVPAPLDGFMGSADWRGVCLDYKMANGVFWPIPITLSTTEETASSLSEGD